MREYLLVAFLAATTTYLLSGLCRLLALRFGAVASIRSRDVHKIPVPYFGGIAMLGGLFAAFLLAANLPFLGKHEAVTDQSMGVLISCLIICAVGVIDDWVELSAMVKMAGQVLAGAVAVFFGIRVYWIPLPNRVLVLDPLTSILLTVLFVFVCVNAINLIDGLDGLASGVVVIGAAAFFSYTYFLAYEHDLVRATAPSLISVAVVGICAGFLPYNYWRAKMFMGDSGAMLLGMAMAAASISFTGQIDPSSVSGDARSLITTLLPVLLPLAVLAVPLFDLVQVYIRRTFAGSWWFVADKRHIHHQLLARGNSVLRATWLMYFWSAIFGFGVVAFALWPHWQVGLTIIGFVVLAAVLTVHKPRQKQSEAVTKDRPFSSNQVEQTEGKHG